MTTESLYNNPSRWLTFWAAPSSRAGIPDSIAGVFPVNTAEAVEVVLGAIASGIETAIAVQDVQRPATPFQLVRVAI